MELLEITDCLRFNPQEIHERDLIRARYHTWNKARNGIVTALREHTMAVLFMPEIHRATTYFIIEASEVRDGKWSLVYTQDFTHIGRVDMTYGDGGSADSDAPDGEQEPVGAADGL